MDDVMPFRIWWPLGARVLAAVLVVFSVFSFYADENPLHLVSAACFMLAFVSFGRVYTAKRRDWNFDNAPVVGLDPRRQIIRVSHEDALGLIELPPGVTMPNEPAVGDFTSDIQAELDRIDPVPHTTDHFAIPHTIETDEQWAKS